MFKNIQKQNMKKIYQKATLKCSATWNAFFHLVKIIYKVVLLL